MFRYSFNWNKFYQFFILLGHDHGHHVKNLSARCRNLKFNKKIKFTFFNGKLQKLDIAILWPSIIL